MESAKNRGLPVAIVLAAALVCATVIYSDKPTVKPTTKPVALLDGRALICANGQWYVLDAGQHEAYPVTDAMVKGAFAPLELEE